MVAMKGADGQACRARDEEIYGALMSKLEDRVLPEAWIGKYTIEMCNKHVTSGVKVTYPNN